MLNGTFQTWTSPFGRSGSRNRQVTAYGHGGWIDSSCWHLKTNETRHESSNEMTQRWFWNKWPCLDFHITNLDEFGLDFRTVLWMGVGGQTWHHLLHIVECPSAPRFLAVPTWVIGSVFERKAKFLDTHFSWLAVLAQGLTDTRYPTIMFLLRIFAVCHVSLSGCCNANADPEAGETTLRATRPALECLCDKWTWLETLGRIWNFLLDWWRQRWRELNYPMVLYWPQFRNPVWEWWPT